MSARVSSETLPPRKTSVGPADLLWLLHTQPADEVRRAASCFGFVWPEASGEPPNRSPETLPKRFKPSAPPPGRQPLRASQSAVVEHQRFREEAASASGAAAVDDGELYVSVGAVAAPVRTRIPLSPPSRLAAFLHQTLRSGRPGRTVDLPRLLAALVRLRLPPRLPLQCRPRWSAEAALILDLSLAAFPLRDDLIELAEQAHALSAGSLPIFCHDSAQGWLQRLPGRAPVWHRVDASAPGRARHWLVAGEAGNPAAHPGRGAVWPLRWQVHLAAGGRLTILTGRTGAGGAARLPRDAAAVVWEYGQRLRSGRAIGHPGNDTAATGRLLAALSLAVVVEPALLREIRIALGLPTACELAAWSHPDSQPCLLGMQIRRERLADYRDRLRSEMPALRQRLAAIIAAHHAGESRLIRLEEAALAADLADFDAAQAHAGWAQAVRTLRREPQGGAARELAAYLRRTGLRAHESLWRSIPNLAEAYVIARREDLEAGASIPAGLPANVLERHLTAPGQAGEVRRWWLVQTAADLVVTSEAPQLGQFLLAECDAAVGFDLQTPAHARQWHPLRGGSERVDMLQAGGGPWVLRSARERIVVAEVPRPSWALAWGRDRQGLYAVPPSLAGCAVKLYWNWDEAVPALWPPSARGFRSPRQQVAPGCWQGADLEYGLYLDVDFAGVVQRFRWIEPGEFLMGSPADEPGRRDDEGPRHRVRLTAGYWLAETACTQALWQAVMGDNPSLFKGDPEKPVNSVSWDDVQVFLQRVQARLAGVTVQLPSEAEWEYACRAGSEGAYAWGETITHEQAIYEEKKGGAVPVKSYPPNAWGLYEMHGNVWEWCADGKRRYDDMLQENPRGPEDQEAPRVVRGGSWDVDAGWLRSARRFYWRRGYRLDFLGFRFSLRSTSQVAGAERRRQEPVALEGPPVSASLPGREGGAASAEAEAAPRGLGGPADKTVNPSRGSPKKRK